MKVVVSVDFFLVVAIVVEVMMVVVPVSPAVLLGLHVHRHVLHNRYLYLLHDFHVLYNGYFHFFDNGVRYVNLLLNIVGLGHGDMLHYGHVHGVGHVHGLRNNDGVLVPGPMPPFLHC